MTIRSVTVEKRLHRMRERIRRSERAREVRVQMHIRIELLITRKAKTEVEVNWGRDGF